MKNKLSLLISDLDFMGRAIIAAVIIILSVFLWGKSKAQTTQLQKLKEQKQLVDMIPQLEKTLEEMRVTGKNISPVKEELNIQKILQGIFIKEDNTPAVLIEDTAYSEGDSFANFTIIKISISKTEPPYVILKNNETNQTNIFRLYLIQ